jgi:hypothetical protein
MARSDITSPTVDLQSDGGSVLWSMVRGEQLEFPITLSFIENVGAGYTYEAVVVEGLNVAGEIPSIAKPSGDQVTLNVRVPNYRNIWVATNSYDREDVIRYSNVYYKLGNQTSYISSTTPNLDPNWEIYIPNVVYVQFPAALSISPVWSVLPTATTAVYGFFELRITEPTGGIFRKTWKPVRGLVKIMYSPTEDVPDV